MRIGLIGGSGSGALRPAGAMPIPGSDAATEWGAPAGPLWQWPSGVVEFVLQHRHGEPHRLLPHEINYRANVWQLWAAGVAGVVAINTVGAIAPGLAPGDLVLPGQLVDYTHGRAASFGAGPDRDGPHVDFTEPFARDWREHLATVARQAGVPLAVGGVYGATQGPRLETAAEIDRLARDGCTVVGMTAMPEAALARELRMPYVLLGLVVNPAAGRGPPGAPIHAAMAAATAAAMARTARVLALLAAQPLPR